MQPTVIMRKIAKQARSKHTISTILQATTQLLNTSDLDQISTNHIAERAGVSIGTLYQYFPNKTAIFLALAEADIERRAKLVIDALTEADPSPSTDPVRDLIRAFIQSFSDTKRNAPLVRLLISTRASGRRDGLPVDAIASLMLEAGTRLGATRPMTEASAFVLTRSILWSVLTATLDAPDLLTSQSFEDELVRLTHAIIRPTT